MAAQAQQPQKVTKKILIVEDDVTLSKMYETKFTVEGFQVLKAVDGKEGLLSALTNKPDMILLDMMVPSLSGLDFLTQLRQDLWGKTAHVIVLTNLSNEHKAQKALELGAHEYVVKSNHTPSQVVAKTRQYIG